MERSGSAPGSDWRSHLSNEQRLKIRRRILETCRKKFSPLSYQELNKLQNVSAQCEEKCYSMATSQEDYLWKVSMRMLNLDGKYPNAHGVRQSPSNLAVKNQNCEGSASSGTNTEQPNQGQMLVTPLFNQSAKQQVLLSPYIQNNTTSSAQGSGVLTMPSISKPSQSTISTVQGRQQQPSQQQLQSHNPLISQQYQLQQHLSEQKIGYSLHMQQQQHQQSLLHLNQLEPSKQPMPQLTSNSQLGQSTIQQMEATMMQSTSQSNRQQNQMSLIHRCSSSLVHHSVGRQQQQQLTSQQSNTSSIQQSQLLGQQNSTTNMQKQQRLYGQQNNLASVQLPSQHSVNILQQTKTGAQQQWDSPLSLSKSQGQQSQHQSSQQALMAKVQSQSLQQTLQVSGTSAQSQTNEQQKQFIQSQREYSEASSSMVPDTRVNAAKEGIPEVQEEIYQKIRSMKEKYFPELNQYYLKFAHRFQQFKEPPPSGEQQKQYRVLKQFKEMLEKWVKLLRIPKDYIPLSLKETLPIHEKRIVHFLTSQGRKLAVHSQSQGQQQFQQFSRRGQSIAEHQLSQISEMQHDNHVNQVQKMNLKCASASMQPGPASSMHLGSTVSSPHINLSTAQQNMPGLLEPASNLDLIQESSFGPRQQSGVGSLENAAIDPLSENTLQFNNSGMQPGSNVIQEHNLKPLQYKQQQHLMQTQHMKQHSQQHPSQHLMHQLQKQQTLQQFPVHQKQNQQAMPRLPVHQGSRLHYMSDGNQLKARQVSDIKSEAYQQLYSENQYTNHHQQLKAATSFLTSSPQSLQVPSPQISQNSSSEIDQCCRFSSLPKAKTPSQSAHSPVIVPYPSTSIVSSHLPGNIEKQSGKTSVPNGANTAHQQTSAPTQAHSPFVVTPGISASPMLSEFTTPEVSQANTHEAFLGELSATPRPLECLIKVVQSLSHATFSSCISSIGSVVSMNDKLACSAPGNGSRSQVGEDLVAMTQCCSQIQTLLSHDGSSKKRMKHDTIFMPLNVISPIGNVNDSYNPRYDLDISKLKSIATSGVKRKKTKVTPLLREKIRDINQQLVDMVVDISENSDEIASTVGFGEGTVVICSFTPVALSPDLKSLLSSLSKSRIMPLRLLLPSNYPDCSPILLDKLPDEPNEEVEDLSVKAQSRFSRSIYCFSKPMSLGEMVKAWDSCVHEVLREYAEQFGGGSFSSTYGVWESCAST